MCFIKKTILKLLKEIEKGLIVNALKGLYKEVYLFIGLLRKYLTTGGYKTREALLRVGYSLFLTLMYLIAGGVISLSVVNDVMAQGLGDGIQQASGNQSDLYNIMMWLLLTALPVLIHLYFKSELRRFEDMFVNLNQRVSKLEGESIKREQYNNDIDDLKNMIRNLTDVVISLRTDFNDFRAKVTENYVKRNDVNSETKIVKEQLNKLDDRIDRVSEKVERITGALKGLKDDNK